MLDRGPCALNPFATVERIFASHALSPACDPVALHVDQENSAAVDASEARLKKIDERHLNLAEGDGFNLHGYQISTKIAAEAKRAGIRSDLSKSNPRPIGPVEIFHSLWRRAHNRGPPTRQQCCVGNLRGCNPVLLWLVLSCPEMLSIRKFELER